MFDICSQKYVTKHLCVLNHIRIKSVVGTVNMFKPSSNRSKAVLLCGSLLLFVFIFAVHSCLFLEALWSPSREGLTSWLNLMFSCVFVTFPYSVMGQVWYQII